MGKVRVFSLASASLLATAWTCQAGAQSANNLSADNSSVIIVTAQKRAESIQDVPASISAIGGEALMERAVADPEQLANQIPGLQNGEYGPTMQFAIRGISLDTKTGAGEPSVALHVDGVYISRPSSPFIDFDDTERVEVLRGPQGTLYGRNATGGAINFVSAEPDKDFSGSATIGAGSFGRFLAKGWASFPLGDSAGLRLTGSYEEDDGPGINLTNGDRIDGKKRYYTHAAFQMRPSDDVQVDLGAYYIRERLEGPIQYNIHQTNYFDVVFPGLPYQFTEKPWRVREEADAVNDTVRRLVLLTGRASWSLTDDLTLRSVTGYTDLNFRRTFSADATTLLYTPVGLNPAYGQDTSDSNTFSQEFNLSGTVGPIDFITGLYHFREHFRPRVPINFPIGITGAIPPGASFLAIGDEKTRSYAAFADLTAHLSSRLRLVGGIRVGRDEKEFVQTFGLQLPTFPVGEGPGFACRDQRTKESWSSLSPKASVQFDATDHAMLYGLYQRGFKSGLVNLTVCGNKVDPEIVDSFEIGMKSQWLDNRATLNLSAFHYDYKDLQVDRTIPGTPPTAILDNAATATVKGVEVETVLNPNSDVSVNVGVTYLDARYNEYVPGNGDDYSGNRLIRAPEWTVKSGAEWRIPLGGFFSRLTLRGELNLTSEVFYNGANDRDLSQPSTVIGNAYVTLFSDQSRVSVRGYVQNIGNVAALTGAILATQGVLGYWNRPRTFGIEVTKDF